jgi:hypothetical protein
LVLFTYLDILRGDILSFGQVYFIIMTKKGHQSKRGGGQSTSQELTKSPSSGRVGAISDLPLLRYV